MPKLHPEEALQSLFGTDYRKALQKDAQSFLGSVGLELVKLLLQAEVTEKCGTKNKKTTDRKFVRWGSDVGSVTVRGAKEQIAKPRVRHADGSAEVQLDTYRALADSAWLTERILNAVVNGVSTRSYARLLEKPIRRQGVSRSTVSRRAIAATKPQVDAFLKKSLADLKLAAILIDGIHFSKRQMIVAIGITYTGRKHVLGMRLGATENAVVARDLISELIDRGLDPEKRYLFVIDGSKALAQAITAAFGERGIIQRCQEHKIRNVLAYLPRRYHARFRAKLTAAYNSRSFKLASSRLQSVRSELQLISDGAVNSLTEGMQETLTLHRLGISGALFKSLRTTNAIESAFSAARRHTCRSTRFRDEQQIYVWATRGLMCAEKNFRTLPGHRQIAKLRGKLDSFNPTSLYL